MRPHLERHNDPDRLKRYIDRLGDEAIGGTIPNFGNRDLFKRLRKLDIGPSDQPAYLHMTLSLPQGVSASKKIWRRIVATALKALGLDPLTTPWFSKRHTDGTCDHVHTAISLNDFAGRPLLFSISGDKSAAIHKYLCAMLGLPTPPYFDSDGAPRLKPITPVRRLTKPSEKALHDDLQDAFLYGQPEGLLQLNAALRGRPGGFQAKMAKNSFDRTAFQFSSGKEALFGGTLGQAWEPRFMSARFDFCAALRKMRTALDFDNLIALFDTPKMEKILDDTIRSATAARAATSIADHIRPTGRHARGGDGPVSPDRPTEPAGRSEAIPDRPGGPAFDRIDSDAKQLSGPAGRDDEGLGAVHQGGRDSGTSNIGTPDRTGGEDRSDPEGAEHSPQLTLGALLARVCAVAAKCAEGWKVKAMRDHRGVAIAFSDGSAALVGPARVKITAEGAEVGFFVAAYQPHVVATQSVDQEPTFSDESMDIDLDHDDTPGF